MDTRTQTTQTWMALGSQRDRRRRRDILELAVGYGLVLLVLWTPPPFQRPIYLFTAAFLIAASLFAGETPSGLGLTTRNLLRSTPLVLLAGALACLGVAVAAHAGTLHAPHDLHGFFHRYWGYAIWALAQQFFLQNFFLLRFGRLFPHRTSPAVLASAIVFSAAHLPSPALTAFTLVWGLIACWVFLRYRNLYPLGVAHAILGIAVAICFPVSVTHNMHVGLGYFYYQHNHAHRNVSDHTVSTRV